MKLPAGSRRLLLAAIAAAGAAFYLYYGGYKVLVKGGDIFGGDFGLCYLAAKNMVSGVSIYLRHPDRDIYLYAPPVTLLFLPFVKMPEHAARLLWLAISHALAWFTFWRLYLWGRSKGKMLSAAAAAGAMLFSMPVYAMLMMGNVNIVIFAMLAPLYRAMVYGGGVPASGMLAFFAVVKIFPGMLAGALLKSRRRGGLAWLSFWLAAAAVFSLVFFGLAENLAFLRDLPGFTKYAGIRHSQSLTFVVRLFLPGIGLEPLAALNGVFLAGLMAVWWRVSGPRGDRIPDGAAAADLFCFTAIMMLTAPSAWIMYGAFYAVPFYFVLHSELEGRREFKAVWLFWAVFAALNFWEIFFYQFPLAGGLTLRGIWLDKELAPRLYRNAFSVLFLVNLGLYSWLMLNYRAFAGAVSRITEMPGEAAARG